MSGIVGHTLYAELALREAARRRLPFTAMLQQQRANFHAGAYLGSDIQVMPEAVCVDTGKEVGFGTVPLERSPITGGPVRQFKLTTPSGPITAAQAWDWGCSGPLLRASGIDWDLRKAQPYDAYAKMDFNVPIAGARARVFWLLGFLFSCGCPGLSVNRGPAGGRGSGEELAAGAQWRGAALCARALLRPPTNQPKN